MNYQYLLFDLDGTLTNPGLGITNSIMYALNKYNIIVENRSELYQFIGPPLSDTFEHYYGFSKEESKIAIGYFREYFEEKGILENFMYNGIDSLGVLYGYGNERELQQAGADFIVSDVTDICPLLLPPSEK